MPPRFAFWTILIDGKPTAFRARDPQELLPTCNQLKRTSKDVVMRWFARGKLWESPEAERAANQRPKPPMEKRSRDWRPGGAHKDPRDRFKKKNRPERAWTDKPDLRGDRDKLGPPRDARPWTPKPAGQRKSWTPKPPGERRPWTPKPPSERPWQTKPTGPRAQREPWRGKPGAGAHGKPAGPGGPRKPWTPRAPGQHKPWTGKPSGPPRGDRKPWQTRPPGGDRKPLGKPASGAHGKKRDDEPPDRG
jgi:hypothetical protein